MASSPKYTPYFHSFSFDVEYSVPPWLEILGLQDRSWGLSNVGGKNRTWRRTRETQAASHQRATRIPANPRQTNEEQKVGAPRPPIQVSAREA
jgi:hypothetical protein